MPAIEEMQIKHAEASVLDEKDRKRIQRYCIFPQLSLVALVMACVLAGLFILGEMLSDVVFYREGYCFAGLAVYLALTVVSVFVFCYCALVPRLGMKGERWKELVRQLRVEQENDDRSAEVAGDVGLGAAGRLLQGSGNDAAKGLSDAASVAGAVGTAVVAADVLAEVQSNAKAMAQACGVPVPKPRPYLVAYVLACVLAMGAAYVPQWVTGVQNAQAKVELAAERIAKVADALEPVCERVTADDPATKGYREYGYSLIAHLREDDGDGDPERCLYVGFTAEGVVSAASYDGEVSRDASMQDNLVQVEQDFATLHEAFASSEAPAEAAGILSEYELSEAFERQFLAGDIYTSVDADREESGDVFRHQEFTTAEQASFTEYTRPRISLYVYGK